MRLIEAVAAAIATRDRERARCIAAQLRRAGLSYDDQLDFVVSCAPANDTSRLHYLDTFEQLVTLDHLERDPTAD